MLLKILVGVWLLGSVAVWGGSAAIAIVAKDPVLVILYTSITLLFIREAVREWGRTT